MYARTFCILYLCSIVPTSFAQPASLAVGGPNHTVISTVNGVCGWGRNGNGEIGDATTVDRLIPVAVSIANTVTKVAAGKTTTLFLKSDGKVYGCGYNEIGQLGLGNKTQQNTPVQLGVGNTYTDIAAGTDLDHTVLLKTGGTVWTCGRKDNGELGLGNNYPTGPGFGCILSTECTCGAPNNCEFTLNQVVGVGGAGTLGSIGKVFAGSYQTFAVHTNGTTVYAWGLNSASQLGDGSSTDRDAPVVITVPGAGTITKISVGMQHTLFLRSDGTVYACGNNANHILADGTTTTRNTPVQCTELPAGTWIDIAAGGGYSLFLRSDGTVWVVGANTYGVLGNGASFPTANITTPTQIGLTNITQIATGAHTQSISLFLKSNNTLWAAGYNVNGQLGNGTTTCAACPGSVGACGAVPFSSTNQCGGNSVPQQVSTSGGCVPTILPVELLSFNASCTNGIVACKWSTASETNNDYFTLERSPDGKTFQSLGTINGAGNSSVLKNYEVIDGFDNLYSIVYYRLKQTDYDGRSWYFDPIAASCVEPDAWSLTLQSIPARDELIATLAGPESADLTVDITDMQGRIIRHEKMQAVNGSNLLKIGLNSVDKGIYFVKVYGDAFAIVKKFSKG